MKVLLIVVAVIGVVLLLVFGLGILWLVYGGSALEKKFEAENASKTELMRVLEEVSDAELSDRVAELLADGNDISARSNWGVNAESLAIYRNRYDVLAQLAQAGGKFTEEWGALWRAVLVQDVLSVVRLLKDEPSAKELEVAFGLACHFGSQPTAQKILEHARASDRATMAQIGLFEAAQAGQVLLFDWLIAEGASIHDLDEMAESVLETAISQSQINSVSELIRLGADTRQITSLGYGPNRHTVEPAYLTEVAVKKVQIAQLLLASGWAIDQLDNDDLLDEYIEQVAWVTGAAGIPEQSITAEEFEQQSKPTFGISNPQKVDFAFWKDMIRSSASGYVAQEKYAPNSGFDRSPVWSFSRFGISTTRLLDGRWVQVAGEHEDSYDTDFHIYNDVIVHDGFGGVQIYIYPQEIFPPTDFHTATLLEGRILLIGSLGYTGNRLPGQTQVLALDLTDFSISSVKTTGDNPGWINRHSAELRDGQIIVSGGQIQKQSGYGKFKGRYSLRLADMAWQNLSDEN